MQVKNIKKLLLILLFLLLKENRLDFFSIESKVKSLFTSGLESEQKLTDF